MNRVSYLTIYLLIIVSVLSVVNIVMLINSQWYECSRQEEQAKIDREKESNNQRTISAKN